MTELITQIKNGEYSCGFAFDSDADRILATDEHGNYLNGSLLGSAHIDVFDACGIPFEKVGYAVDCGPSVYDAVQKINSNLEVKAIPVGRSLVRKKIRDGELDFGIENVGHFYFKEFFMTDSGAFSMVVILYWISNNGGLSNLADLFPDGRRGQIFSDKELDTKALSEKIIDAVGGGHETKKIEVDGVRYEFLEEGLITTWFAIRKSGYEKITKFYFGSLKNEEFEKMKKIFEENIPR